MRTAGIICEYDPFHLGHAWHIAQTRAALGEDCAVVCCMSGHWTQRADCAVADKWTRGALALAGGADLVLELPLPWALSTAERFAWGGVAVLAAAGVVDTLSFGSESGDLARLQAAADCLDRPAYQQALRERLARGLPFAAARQAAAETLLGPEASCLAAPNDNLGVAYLRAIRELRAPLEPLAIRRRGARHSSRTVREGFASATWVRRLLREGNREGAAALMPGGAETLGEPARLSWAERAVLARLRTMEEADFAALPDSGAAEGLPARLCRAARQSCALEEFYALAKTKRYTHARLRRLAVSAFLGLREADVPAFPPYLRVLGLSSRGRLLLRQMKETAALPVITKPAHVKALPPDAQRLFRLEARAGDLYGLCFSRPRPCGLDWTRSPVVRME